MAFCEKFSRNNSEKNTDRTERWHGAAMDDERRVQNFVHPSIHSTVLYPFLLLNFDKNALACRYLRHDNTAAEGDCIRLHLLKKGIAPGNLSEMKLAFTGNGFVGIDAIFDKRLMLFSNASGAHTFIEFYPLAEVESPFVTKQLVSFTDKASIVQIISCTAVSGKCICISNSIYVHRVYPGLLIQEINIANPSSSSFSVSFKRKPSQLEQDRSNVPAIFTQASDNIFIAVKCSELPKTTVSVKPKTEENFRFICYVEKTDGAKPEGNNLFPKVLAKFTSFYARNSDILDKEHLAAWDPLSNFSFHISNSKAPNSLNQPEIDNFKTFLLSSIPLLEERNTRSSQNNLIALESEYCFGGISTMLTPSKLWENANDLEALLKKIEIWKSTLSHRGCSRLIQKFGAHGLAQGFLLSLTAGLFSSGARRLEFSLNPETELHRNIKVSGLRIGNGGLISIDFRLDSALKPFVILESLNSAVPLFACTAGCQEAPQLVNRSPISLSIKMTRPSSPILFISEHQTELEMVGKTLHVVEIFEAPAHEQGKIDLHKHGSLQGGGLSTLFWLILISLLVAFHLFLFKLLYSEWANSSAVTYSKFNKKVLFQR